MTITRLQVGTLGEESQNETENTIEKQALLVYPGKFNSMDGEVEITEDHLTKLAEGHNGVLSKLGRLATGDVPLKYCPPIQLDHEVKATHTVGRLVGQLEVKDTEVDGQATKALFGRVRIMGKDNVEKVKDGRWIHLSIGADLDSGKLNELTITPFPAAPEAAMLSKFSKDGDVSSKGDKEMDYKIMKEKMAMYEKCKKHMMADGKSEEDAEKHLSEMDDEGLKKMSEESDEREKKLAAEEDKEKEKKMSRLTKAKDASAKLTSAMQSVSLARARVSLMTKLSSLKAQGKVSPAEWKKINIEELAGKTEAEQSAFMKAFESREPVIDAGVYGSKQGSNIADIKKTIAMSEIEKESRARFRSNPSNAKLAEGESSDDESTVVVKQEKEVTASNLGDLEIIHKMMSEGKYEEAKEHLGKYMAACKTSSGEQVMNTEEVEKHLSALADAQKTLDNAFKETQQLLSEIAG